MKNEVYRKLVDLYAGDELPEELKDELEAAAFNDAELSHDMATMKRTMDVVRQLEAPEFTEESFQRILMKLYARGVDPMPKAPTPSHLQFHLPVSG